MVDIGVMLPTGVPGVEGETLKAWVREIDAGPFTIVGVADRVKYHNWDHMLTMGMAAALSERVEVMSLVTLPALRQRAGFAKEVATLTRLAPSRITLGVGPGARRSDFDHCETDWAQRGAILDGHLETLMAMRVESSIQEMGPQLGDLQILVGGASDRALGRMLTHGHGYVGGGLKPEIFAFETFAATMAWQGAGREGRPRIVASTWFSRHDDVPEDASARNLETYLLQGGPPPPVNSGIARGADGIEAAVRAYRDQGADEVVFFPMDDDIEQLRWLAEVVRGLPEIPRADPHPDFPPRRVCAARRPAGARGVAAHAGRHVRHQRGGACVQPARRQRHRTDRPHGQGRVLRSARALQPAGVVAAAGGVLRRPVRAGARRDALPRE